MQTINISHFEGYSTSAFAEFLSMSEDSDYKIIMPNHPYECWEPLFDIFWWFHIAGYVGFRLYKLGTNFGYTVPPPQSKEPFEFRIFNPERMGFAELLFLIAQTCYTDDHHDELMDFYQQAADFFSNETDDEDQFATSGLMAIAEEYYEKHDTFLKGEDLL